MPRKPSPAVRQPDKMTAEQIGRGIRRLQGRLEQVKAFDPATVDQNDPWSSVRPICESIETALVETFGSESNDYKRFKWASQFDWPMSVYGTPHHEVIEFVGKDRQRSIQLLEAAITMLNERLEDFQQPDAISAPTHQSKRIFVVHGHDNEPKEAVARYLERLGYEPVILHEQPNKGRTIIQKFQEEANDVGFAIVLMTPDDHLTDGKLRARQNVILELGFFLGRLGPSRVAAIVKGSVERPSDFDGVVYIPFDPSWRQQLAKELVAAGYPVDWNIVMS